MRDSLESLKTTAAPAVKRGRSEGVTLACAVAVAVTLGIAFGLWLNARLAPASTDVAPAQSRLLPDARASAPPAPTAPAAQPSPCVGCETSSAGEATPAREPAGNAEEAEPTTAPKAKTDSAMKTDSGATTGDAREAARDAVAVPSPADEVAAAGAEPRGVTNPEAVAAASPDPSRPVAYQVGASPKAVARANVGQDAAQAAQPGPCTLYASANSLGVSAGGAAPLILGGPGVGVRINVNTPDWKELEVVYGGPAAGDRGWIRYSVKSIGRRPGTYKVRVSSPCGSLTIPVTVK